MEIEVKIVIMIGLSIILSPIFSIFATPIFCLLRKVYYVPIINQKLLKKAIQEGHIVEAKLIKEHDITTTPTGFDKGMVDSGKVMGTYIYEYKGKKYKTRRISRNGLSEEITLYFIKKPRKATSASEIGYSESNWFLYYIIISLILFIVFLFLLGFYLF